MCVFFLQKVDGFISPDSDFFCYGGHTLIKDVYKEGKVPVSQKSCSSTECHKIQRNY